MNGQRIGTARLIPFELPLRRPWVNRHGPMERRRGWLLHLRTDGGLDGWGECTPLSEAGTGTLAEAAQCLETLLPRLRGQSLQAARDDLPAHCTPAVRCALDTAVLDLSSRLAGLPMARWLNTDAAVSVRVNAMAGPLDEHSADAIRRAAGEGYRTFKLKIGLAPVERELRQIHRLAARLPEGGRLRLDANAAFTPEQAHTLVRGLRGLPIDCLEEPLAAPRVDTLAALQAEAHCALAVDESIGELGLSRLLEAAPVRRLVLKPMAVGGPGRVVEIAREARRAGMDSIVTTSVDGAVATWAALHAAAALNSPVDHGLATSSWLAGDVAEPPAIDAATMCLSETPGLGVRPHE
jgi:o-succinylbenzoate synthase